MTTSGDQTRCSRGAAITAAIRAKAATSPSRPQSTVRLCCPIPPLQVNASKGKPSGSYGEGEAEKRTGLVRRLTARQASRSRRSGLQPRVQRTVRQCSAGRHTVSRGVTSTPSGYPEVAFTESFASPPISFGTDSHPDSEMTPVLNSQGGAAGMEEAHP
jgi:hypothetical protein